MVRPSLELLLVLLLVLLRLLAALLLALLLRPVPGLSVRSLQQGLLLLLLLGLLGVRIHQELLRVRSVARPGLLGL